MGDSCGVDCVGETDHKRGAGYLGCNEVDHCEYGIHACFVLYLSLCEGSATRPEQWGLRRAYALGAD